MVWRSLSLSKIIEQIPIGVAVTRPDGRVEYANPHLQALLEEPVDGLVGRPLTSFRQSGLDPVPLDGEAWQGESRLRNAARDDIHVFEAIYPMRDKRGAVAHLVHFFQDLSAQKRSEHLSTLAYYDSLTGLPNRNLFGDRLTRTILAAERQGGGFSLLFIDIDHFKAINDNLGHDAGDRLLRAVATRISRALRKSDTLGRLGGDEFVAILENVRDQAEASTVVEKLFALCGAGYELDGSPVRVTLSVGVSLYPQDGREAATLLEHADRAMYQAKAQGRNCYCLDAAPYGFTPDAG